MQIKYAYKQDVMIKYWTNTGQYRILANGKTYMHG